MLDRKVIFTVSFVLFIVIPIFAARLPVVDDDENTWGDILNEFLNVSHAASGVLREDTVNSTQIVDGAIAAADIGNGTIATSHLITSSVTSEKLASTSVNSSHILSGAITSDKISASSINSTHIILGSVGGEHLSFSSINSSHIVIGSVTASHIAGNSVNSSHIVDSSISGSDIDSNTNITANKFTGTAEIGITTVTDSCSGLGCTATATCTDGKRVITGYTSSVLNTCDLLVSACDNFCVPGLASCSVTSTSLTGGSVYVVCADVL